MADSEPRSASVLFDQWISGLRMRHIGHEQAAAAYAKRGRVLGIPAVLATTAAGTTVLANAGENSPTWVLVTAGSTAVAAALLSAVQTFLDYPALAERHQKAAASYGVLRRQAEQARAGGGKLDSAMASLQSAWAKLDAESPPVPQRFINRALRRIARSHQAASGTGLAAGVSS